MTIQDIENLGFKKVEENDGPFTFIYWYLSIFDGWTLHGEIDINNNLIVFPMDFDEVIIIKDLEKLKEHIKHMKSILIYDL